MKQRKIWTPNLTFESISQEVEKLRHKYKSLQEIPVDIDSFLEFDCGIELVPFSGLRDRIGAEAMISWDCSSIYVDSEAYMNEKMIPRMRFSIAHEIGHMVLHKDFFTKQHITCDEDWISFMGDIQLKYGYLENQANNFAGLLMVSRDRLIREINNNPRPTLAKLTRLFGVSDQVISRRLARSDMQDFIAYLK
ncbi:MAG: ImmA/IrrE family metallo-endopeptidase [Lentisphaeria bacterium]|nr:ImmA/IrrE family metallo-endopeptidase [Lentisphaeria bacterium]